MFTSFVIHQNTQVYVKFSQYLSMEIKNFEALSTQNSIFVFRSLSDELATEVGQEFRCGSWESKYIGRAALLILDVRVPLSKLDL